MDDFLAEIYQVYLNLKRILQDKLDEIEKQLHPLLEVLGALIMAMPVVLILLFLLGFG